MITYRTEKGSPLTIEEMDNNFKELAHRIHQIESQWEKAEGIGKIVVHNNHMTILGTYGTEFGTFLLPHSTLNPKGKWATQTPYQKLDLVTYDHTVYCCRENHQSTLWDQNKSKWQEILSLPKPESSLPLYEKATLPPKEALGKLALLMENDGPHLLYFNGKTWQTLKQGDML